MAALVKRNCFNIFVIVLLFSAYPARVRSKPTTSSSVDKESSNHESKFHIDLDSPGSIKKLRLEELDDPRKTTKPVPKKLHTELFDVATETLKLSEPSQEADSDVAEKSNSKANKKWDISSEEIARSAKQDSSTTKRIGWDESVIIGNVKSKSSEQAEAKKAGKKTTDEMATEHYYSAEDNSQSNEIEAATNKNVKSGESTTKRAAHATKDAPEPLPSAERQNGRPVTTTPPPHSSTSPSGKNAAATLPRALCSFVATISAVILMM